MSKSKVVEKINEVIDEQTKTFKADQRLMDGAIKDLQNAIKKLGKIKGRSDEIIDSRNSISATISDIRNAEFEEE